MPYYPGQPPPIGNQYGYLDEFAAAQANYPQPQPPQYYPQSQPQTRYPQQQTFQPPAPQYYPQSQPVPLRMPQVEVVMPPYGQTQPQMSQPMNVNPRVLQDVSAPNVPRQYASAKVNAEDPRPAMEEFDYCLLLLTLADEYLEAARTLAHDSPEYYKMVATALGCLESILNNFRLQPFKEAHVSLRYAQVLYDETENNDEIETVLTKSIELCERNRFIDLKYTMQALLAQALYRSKPKAAVKDLQSMIEDAEAYRHVAWEYNFRFLSASLSLSSSKSSHDFHNATSQLEKICTVANHSGDYAIYAFSSILQAHVALQTSSPDAVTLAQRSLANARQLQLNPEVAELAQMQILMEFVDLDCSLQEANLQQIEQKMKSMQQVLYERMDGSSWHDDGIVYLPVSKRSLHGVALQEGGTIVERNGKVYLPFRWLPKITVEMIGYLLSAMSVSHKNASDGGKAEKYLGEGLKLLRSKESTQSTRQSLQLRVLECCFLIDRAFLLCCKGDWTEARSSVNEVFALTKSLVGGLPPEIICAAKYLEGAICQGTGDLTTALRIFQSATFALPQDNIEPASARKAGRPSSSTKGQQDNTIRRLGLLAAMNTILIIRSPSHPQHHLLQTILASIEPLINSTPYKTIQASYSLILSTLAESSTTILKTKQHLGNALSTAQASGNAQVTALTLILMSDKFFKGVVGDQAMKCAKAASHQARRSGDPMWLSVAQGMEAECLDIMGKTDEARKLGDAARKVSAELPEKVLRG
jgi:Cohesin loading factor